MHAGVLCECFNGTASIANYRSQLGGLEGELPDDRNRVAAPTADVVGEYYE